MFSIFTILLAAYIILFLVSIKIQDNSIVDIFWGMGFVMIAGLSFWDSPKLLPQLIMTGLIFLWGIRLVSHIGLRKWHEKREDARYATWREEWGSGWYFIVRSFLQVYLLQMALLFVIALPVLIVNHGIFTADIFRFQTDLMDEDVLLFIVPAIWVIWVLLSIIGLIVEIIADRQLATFLKIKKPGEIFTRWLYKYSRHPNYFGESVFWLGISLISLPFSYIGFISWISITILLLFVSGVPLQEARYAGRMNWELYKAKTSVFIPWFPKK